MQITEKRKYLADQIRSSRNIPSDVSDDDLVKDYLSQRGDKDFIDLLTKYNTT
jgi:hypothetical protein